MYRSVSAVGARSIRHVLLVFALSLVSLLSLPWSRRAHAGPNDGLPSTTVTLDRATPRRAVEGFLQAARGGDFARAAYYLDLRGLPRDQHATEGPTLARHLAYVVERKLIVDSTKISDETEGAVPATANVVLGTILLDDEPVPITLTHVRFDDGVMRWVISRTTVSMIAPLYGSYGASEWEDRLPQLLVRYRLFGNAAYQWIGLLLALALSYAIGRMVGAVLIGIGRRIAKRTTTRWDDEVVEVARRPLRMVIAVMLLRVVIEPLHLTASVQLVADRISYTALIIAVAWFTVRALGVFSAWLVARIPDTPERELETRGVRTQLGLMERVASVIIVIFSVAVVLIQFDFVRNFGLSLLASAGIAGIVLGLAAQKSLSGVIAGIQLSITQPIRIGDTVVVEGENGTIEEINLTYVVVRVWDGRRLVVPIARFLDQPFQNWTKISAELLGAVLLQVDFTTPVEKIRTELHAFVDKHPMWDGRNCTLQVTDASDKTITVRALVSAADADRLWTLRCDVREHLVTFLQKLDGGIYLPKARAESVTAPPKLP